MLVTNAEGIYDLIFKPADEPLQTGNGFRIESNGICIYDSNSDDKETTVVSPKLSLERGSAGSLTLGVPQNNIGYTFLTLLTSHLTVYKEDREIWEGRIISEKQDFWNNRQLTCEGELSYLNDTIQLKRELKDTTPRSFLLLVLSEHNARVDASRRFELGEVQFGDTFTAELNYDSTLSAIKTNLTDNFGGFLQVRKENGVRYLDYMQDSSVGISSQPIEFGVNLVDFSRNWDVTDLATVIIPLGDSDDDDNPCTIAKVNNGSIYLESTAINTYGRVERTVEFDGISDPAMLLNKAKEYLKSNQFDDMTLDISAADLHYLNPTYDELALGDKVRVVSVPHGLDKYFPVIAMEIPLDNPAGTTYTLGKLDEGSSLSSSVAKTESAAVQKSLQLGVNAKILNQAKRNAYDLITTGFDGYVSTEYDKDGVAVALYISDQPSLSKASKYWKWSSGGLGYIHYEPYDPTKHSGFVRYSMSPDGTWREDAAGNFAAVVETAMTKDGSIVANQITSGKLTLTEGMKIVSDAVVEGTELPVFEVDSGGNVKMRGSLEFYQSIVKVRYSANKNAVIPSEWSEIWNSAWDNDSTEVWAIYNYGKTPLTASTSWTVPVMIQAKKGDTGATGPQGPQGPAGSAATVPAWVRAVDANETSVTGQYVVSPVLISGQQSITFGSFAVYDPDTNTLLGWLGTGYGKRLTSGGQLIPTKGVLLGTNIDNTHNPLNYLIATEAGIRMQCEINHKNNNFYASEQDTAMVNGANTLLLKYISGSKNNGALRLPECCYGPLSSRPAADVAGAGAVYFAIS